MSGRRCRVVFSYAPQHDDELPLCVGQTIEVLQEVEEGWWKGVLDGQVEDARNILNIIEFVVYLFYNIG